MVIETGQQRLVGGSGGGVVTRWGNPQTMDPLVGAGPESVNTSPGESLEVFAPHPETDTAQQEERQPACCELESSPNTGLDSV